MLFYPPLKHFISVKPHDKPSQQPKSYRQEICAAQSLSIFPKGEISSSSLLHTVAFLRKTSLVISTVLRGCALYTETQEGGRCVGRDDGLGSDPLTAQPRACDLPEPTQGHHILRASQVTRGGVSATWQGQ